jgi:hypothetical protein
MPSQSDIFSSPSILFGPLFNSMIDGEAPIGKRFLAPLEAGIPYLTLTRECPDLCDSD